MAAFRPGWDAVPAPLLDFWTERHLCSLTTLRPDGRPHVVPGSPVAACQVDGGRWSTLEGRATVLDDAGSVARAVERYAARYRPPADNPERVAIRLEVDRFVCGPALLR